MNTRNTPRGRWWIAGVAALALFVSTVVLAEAPPAEAPPAEDEPAVEAKPDADAGPAVETPAGDAPADPADELDAPAEEPSGEPQSELTAPTDGTGATPAGDEAGAAPVVDAQPAVTDASASPTMPPSGGAQQDRAPKTRMRTRNATVVIRSFTPTETLDAAVRKVEALGGYIQASQDGQTEMRVPMNQLDSAIVALRDIGDVVDERIESEDVTLEIITVEARMQELDSSRQRVKGMLALSSDVTDSLSIEKELQQVTSELESNEGRRRYLKNRVALAPITIHVSMKARPPVERPQKRRPFNWVSQYGPRDLLQ